MADDPLQPSSKETVDETALCEQLFQVSVAVLSGLSLSPYLENIQQHQEIKCPDHPNERAGQASADDAAQGSNWQRLLTAVAAKIIATAKENTIVE
jgi:hypothetical protein